MQANTEGSRTEAWHWVAERTAYAVLGAISLCHLLNDTVQSLIPAVYPILKSSYHLDFGQIGMITLTFQATASLLQPAVGVFTDQRPQPYSLPIGMGVSLLGLLSLAFANNFEMLVAGSALVGVGSAVFHPEASRVSRLASGGQHGLAQSVFAVGGNAGSALGPLLAAFIVLPQGQRSIAWFSAVALTGIVILLRVGNWYAQKHGPKTANIGGRRMDPPVTRSRRDIAVALTVLMALIFSKYFYLASLTSFYTFYLIGKFGVSVRSAQVYLFLFLAAVAAGTIIGGPVGDRIGRKLVIWWSIVGVLPFTLLLPYANLFWTAILTVVIGLVLASAFSAILVYAQELIPGRVGLISGLFFGFAFGMGGIGAAVLGKLADLTSIAFVYHVCSFLPAIGLLTGFLPDLRELEERQRWQRV